MITDRDEIVIKRVKTEYIRTQCNIGPDIVKDDTMKNVLCEAIKTGAIFIFTGRDLETR